MTLRIPLVMDPFIPVPPEHYGGDRIVYLSRYLDVDDPIWSMDDEHVLNTRFT